MKIFGREPAAIIAAVQALLVLAASFHLLDWLGLRTQDDVATVVVVLSAAAAVLLAWTTKRTLLAPVIELTKAILALGAIYGLTLSIEQTGFLIGAVTMVLGLFHQTQTAPAETPLSNA